MATSMIASQKLQHQRDQLGRSTATTGFLDRLTKHDLHDQPLNSDVVEHVVDWDMHLENRKEASRIEKGLLYGQTKRRRQSEVRLQALDYGKYVFDEEFEEENGREASTSALPETQVADLPQQAQQAQQARQNDNMLGGTNLPIGELVHAAPSSDLPTALSAPSADFMRANTGLSDISAISEAAQEPTTTSPAMVPVSPGKRVPHIKRRSSTTTLLLDNSGASLLHMQSSSPRGNPHTGSLPHSSPTEPEQYVQGLLKGLHKLDAELGQLRPARRPSSMAVNKMFYDNDGEEVDPNRDDWSHYARAAIRTASGDGPAASFAPTPTQPSAAALAAGPPIGSTSAPTFVSNGKARRNSTTGTLTGGRVESSPMSFSATRGAGTFRSFTGNLQSGKSFSLGTRIGVERSPVSDATLPVAEDGPRTASVAMRPVLLMPPKTAAPQTISSSSPTSPTSSLPSLRSRRFNSVDSLHSADSHASLRPAAARDGGNGVVHRVLSSFASMFFGKP